MDRLLGLATIETDMTRLMRAAERAGLALGCIDPEETRLVLPGDESEPSWTLGRVGAWGVTCAMAAAFLLL